MAGGRKRHRIIHRVTVSTRGGKKTGAEGFIANFPVFDAFRGGVIDGEEAERCVISAIGGGPGLIHGRSRGTQLCPEPYGSPVVALRVSAERDVIHGAVKRCVAVGVGDPRGGFRWL